MQSLLSPIVSITGWGVHLTYQDYSGASLPAPLSVALVGRRGCLRLGFRGLESEVL